MSGEMRIGLFCLIVLALFYAALAHVGVHPFQPAAYIANFASYLSAWVILASAFGGAALYRARPDKPIAYLREVEFGPAYRERLRQSWPILLASILFMPGFSAMKSAIPLFNAFSWDQTFINLDLALHGQDPWRLLQPVIGYPVVTSALSVAYHMWVLLIYGGTIYFALYVPDRSLRIRYFAANFAIWAINGVGLAIVFASVGPCFVGPLLGNPHYADQMAYLYKANDAFPVMVLDVQQQLLAWQTSGSHGLGRGITAMPSMHVALAFLFYLAVRQVSRALGRAFLVFLLIIMIGSVHLAYHYAVDSYLSLIVTSIIWIACGLRLRDPDTNRIQNPFAIAARKARAG